MRYRKDLSGLRFGRLTVIRFLGGRGYRWECRCDCGKKHSVQRGNLISRQVLSCGCQWLESIRTHNSSKTSEYSTWLGMRSRCGNKKNDGYFNYGGRGIKVCKRWQVFENFLEDMGLRPTPQHTLERKNNNGNYSPSNCRWATRKAQLRNTRRTIKITAFGKTQCLSDWAVELKISKGTLYQRYEYGWPTKDLLGMPGKFFGYPRHRRQI